MPGSFDRNAANFDRTRESFARHAARLISAGIRRDRAPGGFDQNITSFVHAREHFDQTFRRFA
jgi:hypothetical protein